MLWEPRRARTTHRGTDVAGLHLGKKAQRRALQAASEATPSRKSLKKVRKSARKKLPQRRRRVLGVKL